MTIILLLGGGLVVAILLVVGVVVEIRKDQSLLDERIDHYVEEEFVSQDEELEEQPSQMTEWLDRRLKGSKWGDKITEGGSRKTKRRIRI